MREDPIDGLLCSIASHALTNETRLLYDAFLSFGFILGRLNKLLSFGEDARERARSGVQISTSYFSLIDRAS